MTSRESHCILLIACLRYSRVGSGHIRRLSSLLMYSALNCAHATNKSNFEYDNLAVVWDVDCYNRGAAQFERSNRAGLHDQELDYPA